MNRQDAAVGFTKNKNKIFPCVSASLRPCVKFFPVLILLLGAGLRFHALAQDSRFHPDEAFFSTFARNAAVNGDWLLHGPLDKTPLSIYASALSMQFIAVAPLPNGVHDMHPILGEFAARLPNTLAGIALIAVVYALAQVIYRDRLIALLSMLLIALSPFAIVFSASSFTDGLMLLLITLAVWAAVRNKPALASVFLALGFASKQQALFYVPLVAAVLWVRATPVSPLRRRFVYFVLPILLGVIAVFIWDAAREQPDSMFALAAAHNNPERIFAHIDELVPRLNTWLGYGAWLLGPGWLTAIMVALGMVFSSRRMNSPVAKTSLMFSGYTLGYALLHWLVAFNTYDRYLLPLLPILALLAARGLSLLAGDFNLRRLALTVSLLIVLLPAAFDAAEKRVPIGGDQGEHDGILELAAWLNGRPVAAVLYDHWFGWELGYYLGQWTNKRVTYYPTPDALVADALQLPEIGARYLPAPADAPIETWLSALHEAGFEVRLAYDMSGFVVYELTPPT
ncbi:MAG: glycosyltransferase family 39 protein [Burkholderiales bacterium]|nr:glycosyltransferase family 39 protein [Anaerolineae bacterium]